MASNEPKKPEKTEKPRSLTYRIIGAAMEVHRTLGPGLLENIYEDAFCIELTERKLRYDRHRIVRVDYKGRSIGNLVVNIIVEGRVIVEVKAAKRLSPLHTAQLASCLKLTGLRTGLVINFNIDNLTDGIKRVRR